jgi:hypothetical protein
MFGWLRKVDGGVDRFLTSTVESGWAGSACSAAICTSGRSMPGSVFKIVVDGGDWGSPMTNEAPFDSLKEAQAEARNYLERQRQAGASLRVTIEEKAPDGTVVKHVVASPGFRLPPSKTAAESPPARPSPLGTFHNIADRRLPR